MPANSVFPYTPENCWQHRRYRILRDGHYITKCSLCNATLETIEDDAQLLPRKIYKCVCGAELIGSLASKVHRCAGKVDAAS